MVMVVSAPKAVTIFSAHFARGEALAVHFQTLCLFACAARFLFFNCGSGSYCLMVGVLELQFER